jgi:hypothetical protein
LFGILDIRALRIDDLDYGGAMRLGTYLEFNARGIEFSSYLGHTTDGFL